MNQHLATAMIDGRSVGIVAGFNRRLRDYLFQVIVARKDMLYAGLQRP